MSTSWRYAAHTTVPSRKTKAEIEELVTAIGGKQFTVGWIDDSTEAVAFKLQTIPIMLKLHHPPKNEATLKQISDAMSGGVKPKTVEQGYNHEVDRRWRCMLIQIKALASMILDAGVDPVNAFIGQVALPGGQTVAERIAPELGEMLESGRMPTLSIGGGS